MNIDLKPTDLKSVEGLVPYARNSRTHSDRQVDQIAASIVEWGWTMPILIDQNGGIIAGHGRVMAAKKLGIEKVPVIIADGWTDAKKRAYVLADNKLAMNAGWDDEMLRLELEELKELDFNLDLIGFENNEILSISFDSDATCEMPGLESGNKPDFTQMTFTLHHEQESVIKEAISHAKTNPLIDTGINQNSNGNALFVICDEWLKIKNGKS